MYVLVTIVLWLLITGARPTLLAYIDKPIEVALVVLLLIDDVRARRLSKDLPLGTVRGQQS